MTAATADARVLALPPAVAERSRPTLEDVREYVEPDLVLLPGPERAPMAVARARQAFDVPVVHPPLGDGEPVDQIGVGNVTLLTVQSESVLPECADALAAAQADADAVVLVCDDVTTTVRPTALETTLECADDLATLTDVAGGSLTVLSGGLPAVYDETWRLERSSGAPLGVVADGAEADFPAGHPSETTVRVHGLGSVERYASSASVSRLTISPDRGENSLETSGPIISVETLSADAFGLEAVSGVGPKTAARLRNRGIETRTALLETPLDDLRSIDGIGTQRARRMRAHAEVLETGQPRRLTDDPLLGEGGRPPLCLDIETDGLSPTIIWQVGVYDPVTDDHRAFVEREEPTDPGPVLESFCEWLLGTHPDRVLCTWNGWRFDYRHLGRFIARHVPHYAAEWEETTKDDLYHWAVREGNALLPGRTNALEAVSRALGFSGQETGLDGATTAAAYERFIRTGEALDWDRHEAYCEDDCRALWHVYDRLRDAPAHSSGRDYASDKRSRRDDETAPTQTGLGDFTQ